MPSTCNKIVKKSLYSDINLKFVENLKYEDLGTNPIIMLNAKSIKYISKPYYEYKIRNNSIMRKKIGTDMIDILNILDERIKKYIKVTDKELGLFKCYTYFWRIEESIINPMYDMEDYELKKYIEYIQEKSTNLLHSIYNNTFVMDKINEFPLEIKTYIINRNKAIFNNSLFNFISKAKASKKFYRISAPDIYYGIKEK